MLLCDGTNGTPDLRNRFIYGGDGTNNGTTGGEEKHQLTVDELAAHNHPINSYSATGGTTWALLDHTNAEKNGWKTNIIESAGGDQPHNNMPPYHVLAWIMKL